MTASGPRASLRLLEPRSGRWRQRHRPCAPARPGSGVAFRERRPQTLVPPQQVSSRPAPSPEGAHGDLGGLTAAVPSPQAEGDTGRPRQTPLDTGAASVRCVQGRARCWGSRPQRCRGGRLCLALLVLAWGTLACQWPAGAGRAESHPDADPCRPAPSRGSGTRASCAISNSRAVAPTP